MAASAQGCLHWRAECCRDLSPTLLDLIALHGGAEARISALERVDVSFDRRVPLASPERD
jgi:hypothetical protein